LFVTDQLFVTTNILICCGAAKTGSIYCGAVKLARQAQCLSRLISSAAATQQFGAIQDLRSKTCAPQDLRALVAVEPRADAGEGRRPRSALASRTARALECCPIMMGYGVRGRP
jgi:hypothetical protein